MMKAILVYDLSECARACIATHNAVTATPCPHGYTWQCPKVIERYAFIMGSKEEAAAFGKSIPDQPSGDYLLPEGTPPSR